MALQLARAGQYASSDFRGAGCQDQSITVLADDRILSRKFELLWDADGLATAVFEQLDVAKGGHGGAIAYAAAYAYCFQSNPCMNRPISITTPAMDAAALSCWALSAPGRSRGRASSRPGVQGTETRRPRPNKSQQTSHPMTTEPPPRPPHPQRQGPRHHLRHHHARRRAVARRLHVARREAGAGQDPRGDGGRRDRGRLPDRLQRRLRGRARDRQDRHREHRLRPGPRRRRRHRALRRGDPAGQARPHPHLHLHQPAAHASYILRMEPEDVLDAVTGSVTQARNLCGDVEWSAAGRHPHRARLPRAAASRRRSRPAPARSTCPTPSATPIPTEYAEMFRDLIERVPGADTVVFSAHCHNDLGLAVANSLVGGAGRRAAGGSARSTASASGPATRRWRRW